jgi:hypothetical protein
LGCILVQRHRRQLQAGARHAADGDQVDLVLGARAADAARHRQRREVDRLGGAGVGGAQQQRGAARGTGGVHLAGQAQLGQQVVLGELPGLGQLRDQGGAGLAVHRRIVEQGAGFRGHVLPFHGARQQA